MNSELLLFSGVLLLSTLLSSISQVMLKRAAMREWGSRKQEYLNPLVLSAYSIFFGCTLLTLLSLKVVPLGLGTVLEATGYIYVTILGVVVFKERVGAKKALAMMLIFVGVIVYALS